jgi:hypothetical protein
MGLSGIDIVSHFFLPEYFTNWPGLPLWCGSYRTAEGSLPGPQALRRQRLFDQGLFSKLRPAGMLSRSWSFFSLGRAT